MRRSVGKNGRPLSARGKGNFKTANLQVGDRALFILAAIFCSVIVAVTFGPDFSVLRAARPSPWRTLRDEVIALRTANAPRISDPAWSSGGQNLAAWAERGALHS